MLMLVHGYIAHLLLKIGIGVGFMARFVAAVLQTRQDWSFIVPLSTTIHNAISIIISRKLCCMYQTVVFSA
jgi:hypothetical protein